MHNIAAAYVFTIPSLADGIALDCRIYHPALFDDEDAGAARRQKWVRKGAVVAHPYAPLGGCMDDPVVMTAVEQLLDLDFVVGTFNFRGAAGSKGSTSWSSRPEREDYISFAGFLIHYLNNLHFPAATESTAGENLHKSDPLAPSQPSSESIAIVLGGYSYGSLIVSQLPDTSTLLRQLTEPSDPTAATEILLRARNLATKTNQQLEDSGNQQRGRSQELPPARGHKKNISHHSVVIGGNETPPSSPGGHKTSHDGGRRSTDLSSRIMDRVIHHHGSSGSSSSKNWRRSSSHGASRPTHSPPLPQLENINLPNIKTHYLLISPIFWPVSTVLSPSLTSFAFRPPEPEILLHNPTLVIFATEDGFTSGKRVRGWCRKMEMRSTSEGQFSWHEQDHASHFWREKFVMAGLRGAIKWWVENDFARP